MLPSFIAEEPDSLVTAVQGCGRGSVVLSRLQLPVPQELVFL